MKSKEEIEAQIEALKDIKPNVIKQSMFGDNHHDAIDCQIEVLEKRMKLDDIYDRHDGAAEDELFSADNEEESALQAARWMWEHEDMEGPPSEGWAQLLKK